MMKKLFVVNDESNGEVEGIFDEAGNLLGYWWKNDANWRNEYFSGFMEKLGFQTMCIHDDLLIEKLREASQDD